MSPFGDTMVMICMHAWNTASLSIARCSSGTRYLGLQNQKVFYLTFLKVCFRVMLAVYAMIHPGSAQISLSH
jgi:hypothetical protein